MSDVVQKCTVCGALLDEEDLFCSECGTEAPLGTAARPPTARLSTNNFICDGCGAAMSYDASVRALRCPFCGSEQLHSTPDAKEIRPQAVVRFAVSKESAEEKLRAWLGEGFWRPGDLAKQALVVKMTPVYVPFWVFEAKTWTYWTADSSQTPPGARGDWFPLFGEQRGTYADVMIGASSVLTGGETNALGTFDLSEAAAPEEVDLDNVTYERFTMVRKYARPLARGGIESLETEAIGPRIPGRSRNLKVNVRITDLTSMPALLPVWVMAYQYREKTFRFLVNGQTGRSTGAAPVSYRKISVAVAVVVAVLLIVLFLALGRG